MLSSLIEAERPLKASEVSEATGIPRTKVYQVGKSLEERGLIRCVGYRPTLFIGPPKDKLASMLLRYLIEDFSRKISLIGRVKPFNLPLYLLGEGRVVPVFGKLIIYLFENVVGRADKALMIVDDHLVDTLLNNYRENAEWEVMFTSVRAAVKAKGILSELRICNSPFSGIIGEREGVIVYAEGKGIYTTDRDLLKSLRTMFYIVRAMSFLIG